MFTDRHINGKQSGSKRHAESVAVHESDLRADGLMLEEVFLWRDHVGQNLTMRFHDLCYGLVGDLGQKLKTVVGL